MARGDPDAGTDRAETEPQQPRTQRVALLPLALGHGEHREDPAFVQRAPRSMEDAAVAFVEHLARVLGQCVSGRSVLPFGLQQSTAFEPGDRRADGGFVDAELGHQPDDRADAEPAADLARIETVDGDDMCPGVRAGMGTGSRAGGLVHHRAWHYRDLLTLVIDKAYWNQPGPAIEEVTDAVVSLRPRRHLLSRQPAAGRTVAGVPVRPAGGAVSATVELRCRAARLDGRATRRGTAVPADPGRVGLDLRRRAAHRQPDRQPAGRGVRDRAR